MATGRGTLIAARPRVGWTGRVRGRPAILALLGVVALVGALILGVGLGSVAIAPGDALAIVAHRALGLNLGVTWSPATEAIVWELRVPRVLTAMVVGTGLAVAGATFQGLLRNPLADPYVLGSASGAALGAAIAVLLPIRVAFLQFGLLQGLAFTGALLATLVVYRLSRLNGLSPMTSVLLTGYAVGSLLAAGLALAMYLSGAALRQIFGYLLGGFDRASWELLLGTAPIILIGSALVLGHARALNGLLLGEEAANHLGVDVRRERAWLLGLGSLVTAAAVAISGLIGFIGLVVPHVVRLLVGPNARVVIPLSAIFGAALLSYADLVARLLGDIPVGVVTAVIGAPFFLLLLRRTRTGYEL
jgi:iron complex transport system permease protein